ncbi:universal stress protein [Rhizobium sp. 18055]|uniref:universal stress protein n=1 Tax=Rhizobium sp. 18055 TaxID=2681403 RepID=UPI00135AE272|nr:universal stress protein [Rhizobium sp. 18055]
MTSREFPRHILFATDFSARCDRAQDRAIQLALQWRAKLTVLFAFEADAVSASQTTAHASLPRTISYAACRLEEELSGIDTLQSNVEIRHGAAYEVIAGFVAEMSPDIVVTGISSNDKLGRSILGSTTTSLLRMVVVPVLAVKKKPIDSGARVLVASDLSEGSADALRTAIEYFDPETITLFLALDPPFRTWTNDTGVYERSFEAESLKRARDFLDKAIAKHQSIEPVIVAEVGDPSELVARYAMDHDIDIVVTGTEGRGGLLNVLVESVASGIMWEAPCDVFVVPQKRRTSV